MSEHPVIVFVAFTLYLPTFVGKQDVPVALDIIVPLKYHWYVVLEVLGVVILKLEEAQTKIVPDGDVVGFGF